MELLVIGVLQEVKALVERPCERDHARVVLDAHGLSGDAVGDDVAVDVRVAWVGCGAHFGLEARDWASSTQRSADKNVCRGRVVLTRLTSAATSRPAASNKNTLSWGSTRPHAVSSQVSTRTPSARNTAPSGSAPRGMVTPWLCHHSSSG